MGKENFSYGGFQKFKDVCFKTDRNLQPHYSEKGGHKARHDVQKSQDWLRKQELRQAKKETVVYDAKTKK
jgi:hypothetical protein